MIKSSKFGEVNQFLMGREYEGTVLYTMAAYYIDGLLIDTGPSHIASEVEKAFENIRVEQVVNTHHHEDHIGNNDIFQNKGISIFAHPLAVPLIKDPSLWTAKLLDYQKIAWGNPPSSNASELKEYLNTSNYSFRVLHTPGHSYDHIALLEENEGWLFSGDLFLGEKVKMLRSDEEFYLSMDSLSKLINYNFDTIFCSSGRVFDNAKQRLQKKLDWWTELSDAVLSLSVRGYDAEYIRDHLLGEEFPIAALTEGDLSKLNLIKSILSRK